MEKLHKIFENWKVLRFFVISGVNLRHFHSERCNYLLIKDYWTTNRLTRKNIPIHEVCQNFNKKSLKLYKLENFGIFVIFGVNLRYFHTKICNELFGKAYWTIHAFLVDHFQCSNLRSPAEIWDKMHKTPENVKVLGILSFPV